MDVTVHIPDEIADQLAQAGGDLARRALEALALEEWKAGHITKVQLRKMLGLERIELDGFFKQHNTYEEYTMEDFEGEQQALKELGF